MDFLNITGLKIPAKIGIHEWEQRIEQHLLIDINIPMDFSKCTDDISATIDYDALCQTITEHVCGRSFQLIETVANQVAALIKAKYSIQEVTVAVSKPHAVKNALDVRVVVSR